MKKLCILLILFSLLFSCKNDDDVVPEVTDSLKIDTVFASIGELKQRISEYSTFSETSKRDSVLTILFNTLKTNNKIPYVKDDSVLFLAYNKSASSISWAGDFNGWDASSENWLGSKIETAGVWYLDKTFPTDARLDYKIIVNENSWILDSYNQYIQYSGFGPNSELRMPMWIFPQETILKQGVNIGTLSSNIIIASSNLGYNLQYKVYQPYNYENLNNLPVVYVTDGHEYSDDKLGAMLIVTDNLISSGDIEPIIIVFIDPRNPSNLNQNRRAEQFRGNPDFLAFVAYELVPFIDANYKTDISADKRAIMGTSYGGWNASYFGLMRSDVFGLLCIHSPAFDTSIPDAYEQIEKLPLKIFMSTGVINDTQVNARLMENVLQTKGYTYQYIEVNQGHSWGNWRALIDEPLIFFFGTK